MPFIAQSRGRSRHLTSLSPTPNQIGDYFFTSFRMLASVFAAFRALGRREASCRQHAEIKARNLFDASALCSRANSSCGLKEQ